MSELKMLERLLQSGFLYEACACGCEKHHHEGRRCTICNDFCPYTITYRLGTKARMALMEQPSD